MRIACWILKATHTHTHTHTLSLTHTICNIYCSFTAKMVARTHLSFRLYVHFPSLSKRSNGLTGSCPAHDVPRPKTNVEGFTDVVRSCVSVGGRARHLLGPHEVTDLGQGCKPAYRVIDLADFAECNHRKRTCLCILC